MSLRRVLRRRLWDQERVREMEAHIAHEIDDNMARGLSAEEARRQAYVKFGNPTVIRERIWQMNSFVWLESLWRDACYATRQLYKSPGISLIAIATLALGIGANTAVFSLTWAVILKGLPVPRPERLVEYVMDNGQPTTIGLSGPMYEALKRRQRDCTGLLAWASDMTDFRSGGASEQVHLQMLSGSAFRVLEIQPYFGSFFGEQTEGGEGVPAVLSYEFWQKKFHGDSGAIGRTFLLANHPVTIVGVMPKGFHGLTANFQPEVYVPLSFVDLLYGPGFLNDPKHFGLYVLGRLKPGVSVADANSEVEAMGPAIRREADPSGIYLNQSFKNFHLRARSGRNGVSWVKEVYSRPLFVLELLVAFLLVQTCLNTALVMMARVSGRQQEYAVRSALGAGKQRLFAQVFTETALLVIPGLAGGVLLGWGAAHGLITMLGVQGGASSMNVRPNGIILGFNACVCLLVAFAAGLWPGFRAARIDPAVDLRSSDRSVSAKRLGGWIVTGQVAVSVSLVTSAVLLGSTLAHLLMRDSGFNAQGTALASLDLPGLRSNPAEKQRLVGELLRKVREQPGVLATGFTAHQPLTGYSGATNQRFAIESDGNVQSDDQVLDLWVSPEYFSAIGTRLLSGKSAAAVAQGAMPQCVLSYNLASRFFPDESAIGRIIYASTPGQPDGSDLDVKRGCLVTGVAEDARVVSLRLPAPQVVYKVISPEVQGKANSTLFTDLGVNLIVQAQTDELGIAALRNAIQDVVGGSMEAKYRTFRELEESDLNRQRMLVSMSATFALLALLLTALGMYGLLMRIVVLRKREIGLRMALGATRRAVAVSVARRVLIQVGIGLLAGTAITIFLTRAIRDLLGNSPSAGVPTYLISASTILLVSAVAILFPVLRAASVDPVRALRSE